MNVIKDCLEAINIRDDEVLWKLHCIRMKVNLQPSFVFLGDTDENKRQIDGKSILLISTPHSGKTTLIQGIMNYILGVRFNDDFRFCLPPDIADQV